MVLSESDIEKIKGIFTDRFLNTIADRVTQILDKKFAAKLKEQETTISKLKQEIQTLKEAQCNILKSVDDQEQAFRNQNVRIFGLPVKNDEDLCSTIQDLFKSIKVNISDSGIQKCYRVQSKVDNNKPPAVIVRFSNDSDRLSVLRNKKELSSTGVSVKEDLTKSRLTLLAAAVNKYTFKNAWCRNGVVYVKIGGKIHRINGHEDLAKNLN